MWGGITLGIMVCLWPGVQELLKYFLTNLNQLIKKNIEKLKNFILMNFQKKTWNWFFGQNISISTGH